MLYLYIQIINIFKIKFSKFDQIYALTLKALYASMRNKSCKKLNCNLGKSTQQHFHHNDYKVLLNYPLLKLTNLTVAEIYCD